MMLKGTNTPGTSSGGSHGPAPRIIVLPGNYRHMVLRGPFRRTNSRPARPPIPANDRAIPPLPRACPRDKSSNLRDTPGSYQAPFVGLHVLVDPIEADIAGRSNRSTTARYATLHPPEAPSHLRPEILSDRPAARVVSRPRSAPSPSPSMTSPSGFRGQDIRPNILA